MYLTDIITEKDLEGNTLDVPVEFIREQVERMKPLLHLVKQLEDAHREVFGRNVYFAPGFLMYLDYLIHKTTSGTVQ